MASQLNATRRLACSLLAGLLITVAASSAGAQQLDSLADEYRRLIALGDRPRSRGEMNLQFLKLTRMAPTDGTIPYTHALLLAGQRQYDDAVASTARSLAVDSSNLNAWRLHTWLQLQTEQFAPALKSVAQLARFMPDVSATGRRREEGQRMAEYFGTVAGYIAGPRGGELPAYDLIEHERDIRSYMTSSQQQAFERGRERIMADYDSRNQAIEVERQNAYGADVNSREAQIAQMAAERARIQADLEEIEKLRLQAKAIAAGERNTLAATRERLRQGTYSYTREDEINTFRTRGGGVRTREVNDYLGDNLSTSGLEISKGFGDKAYKSVGQRNAAYDRYLDKRGDTLLRQLQVMERKEVALRTAPVTGSSPRVGRLERKAKLLTEYLALPVDPQTEITGLLVQLERFHPAGSVAQTLEP